MTKESVSLEPQTVTCTCKNCNKEFTYIKLKIGGRPRIHCSDECTSSFADANKVDRKFAANRKLQAQYLACKSHNKRQAYLYLMFDKYARYLAKLPRGLSRNQAEGLTNKFLFGNMDRVTCPHTGKQIEPIYDTFISFCHNTMRADPYDKRAVIERAKLIPEMKDRGIALPEARKPVSERKQPTKRKASDTATQPVGEALEARETSEAVADVPASEIDWTDVPAVLSDEDLTAWEEVVWLYDPESIPESIRAAIHVARHFGFDPSKIKCPSQLQGWIMQKRSVSKIADEYCRKYA
ncbi:hypothetical protein [Cereibacter sphaeroides]|jgi:hypothetical protein|uniref:hypothetical protein n=1 Tax=Cereibacter sphaeroides TaxID=1063 RepID=UPI001359D41F